jgi:alpha-L-rhamnosidase
LGIKKKHDWSAAWIADPILADPKNRPRTPINCYLSKVSNSPDTVKWITVDLGALKMVDGVRISPARPDNESADIRTILYPLRFKILVSATSDFSGPTIVVYELERDVNPPRTSRDETQIYRFPRVAARYIRLEVTRLALWDGNDYALALGRFQVFDGDTDISSRATVKCSDIADGIGWSGEFLTDPSATVGYCAIPTALQPQMGSGVESVSRVPMLRRDFVAREPVKRAVLYCAARGFYEVALNGKRVGEDLLSGGYTQYNKRIQYQTYDVTEYLRAGPNVMGAMLGYGWYAGHMNLANNEYISGFFPQFTAQLEIEYVSGKHEVIVSDGNWKSTLDGPMRWSDILDGEGYDCTKELIGWNKPGFDDKSWVPVTVIPRDNTPIVWQRAQAVTNNAELVPIGIKCVGLDTYVFDFGQEISGWCKITVDGPVGAVVSIKHSEERNPDGSVKMDNLWGVAAAETYILDGRGKRVLAPHFTWHGFRFAEVTGLTSPPTADTVRAVHIRSGCEDVSQFDCSNSLYNSLMKASRWTQRNLLFDVPAGCAGRAERLAWTGDIRPCVAAALYHFDSAAFFEKYAADVRTDQTDEGRFTDIAPHAHLDGTDICVGSPGWADAGVSLPWDLYLNTGDLRVLSENYQAARRWVDYIYANNPDFLWANGLGMGWGDWLSGGATTPLQLGATTFFANSTDIVSKMAHLLGKHPDAARYKLLFSNIRQAFMRKFVSPDGIIQAQMSSELTGLLRSRIANNTLQLTVSNVALGGDPAPNMVKNLHLIYQIGNVQMTEDIPEDGVVNLDGAGQTLTVISATYGIGSTGRSDAEGSYALALRFGLLDEPLRSAAIERLVEVIDRNGGHPTTGFWSSVELLLALSDYGHHDIASRMMAMTTVPSWGYMVQGDGTTCWESFDADQKGLSLNHWTHSAISEWMWRNVAGISIDPNQPGFDHILIQPKPSGEVSACSGTYESVRGSISVSWQSVANEFSLAVEIPANTTATVTIPGKKGTAVTESGRPATVSPGVQQISNVSNGLSYRIQSGSYRFHVG